MSLACGVQWRIFYYFCTAGWISNLGHRDLIWTPINLPLSSISYLNGEKFGLLGLTVYWAGTANRCEL